MNSHGLDLAEIRNRDLSALNKALIHNNDVIVVIVVAVIVVAVIVVAVIVALEGRIVLHRFLVVVVTWLESGEAISQGSVDVESQSHEGPGMGVWRLCTKEDLKSLMLTFSWTPVLNGKYCNDLAYF